MLKRLVWATICLPFPALLAGSVLGYDYGIEAPFPASVSGRVVMGGVPSLVVSKSVVAATATGTIYGKATFGNSPPQQNLWGDSGSGSRPKL